jgi:archaellum biogenesis ATPase FlaH
LDIVEYLSDKGVQLKPGSAGNFHGLCMMCNEEEGKPGRFYIQCDPSHERWGQWFCFLCEKRGGANALRAYYGDAPLADASQTDTGLAILDAATQYYAEALLENDEVFDYLTYERGLQLETILKNKLGWADPDGGLMNSLLAKGFDLADIKATGLVNNFGKDFFRGRIIIPYIEFGSTVSIRGKEIGGKYLGMPGVPAKMYGLDNIVGQETVLIAAGEFDCYSEDTEILTPDGWVCFADYKGQELYQWNEDWGLELVSPRAWISKEVDSTLLLSSVKNGGVSFNVTPSHRMVSFPAGEPSRLKIHPASTTPSGCHVPRTSYLDGPGLDLSSDEIALLVAIQADGTFDLRKSTGYYYCRFSFSKTRKIQRLTEILEALDIGFSLGEIASGVTSICFRLPIFLEPFKEFPFEWITKSSLEQKNDILKELGYWDCWIPEGGSYFEYSTSLKSNVDWVSTLAHTAGKTATIKERSNKHGSWWRVNIVDKVSTSWQAINRETVNGSTIVHCVEVPSSMLLVRHNNSIAVSGNCLVLQQLGYNAIGFPGERIWKDEWEEYFDEAKRLFIIFDSDSAGKAGAEKLATTLGPRSRVVELPQARAKQKKIDVSEWFVKHNKTKEDFDFLISKSKGGLLVSVAQAYDRWLEIEGNPHLIGLRFNIPALDSEMQYGLLPGQVATLLARTNTGKTAFCLNVLHRMKMLKPDIKILLLSLEQTRNEWFERAHRIHCFYEPDSTVNDTIDFWKENLFLVDKNRMSEQELELCLEQFKFDTGFIPHLTVIDYLGYFARSYPGEEYARTSSAIMGLKAIAKDHQTTILTPHQANRGNDMGEEVKLDAGRGSGVTEETSDLILSLWNPDQKEGLQKADHKKELIMKVQKSRDGGVGAQFKFQYAPLTLAIVPYGDTFYPRAVQERDFWIAGDDWKQAVYRHKTGDMSI